MNAPLHYDKKKVIKKLQKLYPHPQPFTISDVRTQVCKREIGQKGRQRIRNFLDSSPSVETVQLQGKTTLFYRIKKKENTMVLNEQNLMIALQSKQTIRSLSALFPQSKKGQIYKLLGNLKAEGKIETVGTEETGSRPRQIFKATQKPQNPPLKPLLQQMDNPFTITQAVQFLEDKGCFFKNPKSAHSIVYTALKRGEWTKDNSRPVIYTPPQVEEIQVEESQVEEIQVEETQDPFELAIQKLKEELDLLTTLKDQVSFIKTKLENEPTNPVWSQVHDLLQKEQN